MFLSGIAGATDIPFSAAQTIDSAFDGATSVFVANVDGDGDMDVLGAAQLADDFTWWENTASNPGPSDTLVAVVEDFFPPQLIDCEWTCATTGFALCTPGPVSGDLLDNPDLLAGSSATYTATCMVDSGASFLLLTNSVTIDPPIDVTDPDMSNNIATDEDIGPLMVFRDGFE